MKELFGRLIRAFPVGGAGRGRDEPERPEREVVAPREEGNEALTEDVARRRLDDLRQRHGDRHPEFAAAATDLAALLQARGDLDAAEPLLRQALEARREALGEHHPDYAASLSRLGSLLFARHDHAAAEPLLRQAVAVRKDALGARHPDVVADLRTLEAIFQARARPALVVPSARGAAKESVPIPTAASDTALEQLGRGPREIAAEARGLAETFARVGAALAQAANGMRHGLPPQISLLNDSAGCYNAFVAIHDEALGRAEALDLAPREGTVLPLLDLAALMDRVALLEDELPARAAAQRQALAVLDRVLSLRHRVEPEFPPLRPCHEAASKLRKPVAEARLSFGIPEDAYRLAGGDHPLASLARLVGPGAPLGDDDWSRLHREVSATFGRPLAAAAVRGRLEPSQAVAANGTALSGAVTSPGGLARSR